MITNVQAVKFCNEHIRPLADTLASAQAQGNSVLAMWDAKGLGALIPNTTDVVMDGSDVDGRTQITGADVNTFIKVLQSLQATMVGVPTSIIGKIEVNQR